MRAQHIRMVNEIGDLRREHREELQRQEEKYMQMLANVMAESKRNAAERQIMFNRLLEQMDSALYRRLPARLLQPDAETTASLSMENNPDGTTGNTTKDKHSYIDDYPPDAYSQALAAAERSVKENSRTPSESTAD